jgi:hypothetical protein
MALLKVSRVEQDEDIERNMEAVDTILNILYDDINEVIECEQGQQ